MKLNSLSWGLFLLGGLADAKRPNILFILTDDQDNHMNSVEHMRALQHHIVNKGTTYTNHYCTVSLCCPSRATLWTGRHAHNHNVTSVKPPYGGYIKVRNQGINADYLPLWMQNAGYNTYYTGKLWNAYGMKSMPPDPAAGWTGSDILLDPWTYRYWDGTFSRDGSGPNHYKGQYSPDVVAKKASDYLDDALKSDKPWFLVAAPVAPHNQVEHSPVKHPVPPPSAARHEHLFKDFQIPRTPMFNPDQPAGASFIKDLPKLGKRQIEHFDEWQRARLRALQSVDEMIDDLVSKVKDAGVMDNTYIIFSTDNGFHIGQYRMQPGKKCAYQTDINIPLFIRGPGIPAGGKTDAVSSHVDLAPTFMKIASQNLRDDFDGSPIGLSQDEFNSVDRRTEHTQAEFWGASNVKGMGPQPNTYKAVRIVGQGYNLLYTVWCTNEHELYDLDSDPYQLSNLYTSDGGREFKLFGRPFKDVVHRLDALTMVLKSCKSHSCRQPWHKIHRDEHVRTLREALHHEYDHLYAKQPKVRFEDCALGYIKELEGPQHVIPDKHHGKDDAGDASWLDDVSGADELELRKRWMPFEGAAALLKEMRDPVDDDSPEWVFEDDPEFDSDDELEV